MRENWNLTFCHAHAPRSYVCHSIAILELKLKLELSSGILKSEPNRRLFGPCDREIWRMILKKTGHLSYDTFSFFQSHLWIQTGVTYRSRSIRVKIVDYLSRVTLKLDKWPRKTIWHLFCAASSFAHHFATICGFKLELQSRNAQFGSKLRIFVLRCLEIWQMTVKNNRARLLNHFKLFASFYSHLRIEVWKCTTQGKICFDLALCPLIMTLCMGIFCEW